MQERVCGHKKRTSGRSAPSCRPGQGQLLQEVLLVVVTLFDSAIRLSTILEKFLRSLSISSESQGACPDRSSAGPGPSGPSGPSPDKMRQKRGKRGDEAHLVRVSGLCLPAA